MPTTNWEKRKQSLHNYDKSSELFVCLKRLDDLQIIHQVADSESISDSVIKLIL